MSPEQTDFIGGALFCILILAFCTAVIYAIFQVGRYFKKKADSLK